VKRDIYRTTRATTFGRVNESCTKLRLFTQTKVTVASIGSDPPKFTRFWQNAIPSANRIFFKKNQPMSLMSFLLIRF